MGARKLENGKAKLRRTQDRSGSSKMISEDTEYTDYEPPRRSNRFRAPSHVTSKDAQDERSYPTEIRNRRNAHAKEPSKKRPRPTRGRIEDYDEEYLNSPMNDSERSEWKGWCEIESDPAFFNAILKEWGVKGVKIQEVIGLDDELLAFLPKPIYGLIFLFEYREDSPDKMVKCPDNVWFAHQIAQNSCASVALLNLIMNIPDIDVGDVIENLRRRTATDTSPQQRGQVVKNCEFVRNVHNSFARKSDLFTEVKDMKQPRTPQKVPPKSSKRKARFTNKKRKKVAEEEEENAFHFIAFVPINGKLWKLDGMDAQPMNLGPFEDDWMNLARPEISARMAAYENDAISFSLQALCRSPLDTIPTLLAENIAQLLSVESELASKDPEWSVYLDPESSTSHVLLGPDEDTCVTAELLSRAKITLETRENACPKITKHDNSVMELMDIREKVVKKQNKLRGTYMEEIVAVEQDDQRTKNRRQSREDGRGDKSTKKQLLTRISKDPLAEHQLSSSPVQRDTPDTETTEFSPVDTYSNAKIEHKLTEKQGSDTDSNIDMKDVIEKQNSDTDSNTEMNEACGKRGSESSSIDIPLNAALTIHSDGIAT